MENMDMEDTANMDMVKENNSVLVSVIVPVYNAENWLPDLLHDLCSQTYKELEILLINDGSTDNSYKICNAYLKRDSRIRILNKENGGVSSARNLGIQSAIGRFLRFVDSDDRLGKDSIQQMVLPALNDSTIELVVGSIQSERDLWNSKIQGIVPKKDLIQDMTNSIQGFFYGVMWNKLYLREIIINYHILLKENISWCEDYLFNLEYITHLSKNIFYTKQQIYQYICREGSLVSKVSLDKRIFIENLCLKRLEIFAKREGIYDAYEEHRAYIKHGQMCNLCKQKTSYSNFQKICLKKEDIKFWITFKNPKKTLAYKILKLLIRKNKYYIAYLYINLKEKGKKYFKRLRENYYRNHERNVSKN